MAALVFLGIVNSGCNRKKAPVKPQMKPAPVLPAKLPLERPAGDPEEARKLTGALELAAVYRSKGMLSQAKTVLVELLTGVDHPANRTRALFELSQVYIAQGKLPEAAALFEKNPSKDPVALAFRRLYLANIYQMQQKNEAAEKIYLALLKDPLSRRDLSLVSNVTSELSKLYTRQGKPEKAIDIYSKVLNTMPAGAAKTPLSRRAAAQARLQMATYYLQGGKPKEAVRVLEELLEAAAADKELKQERESAQSLYISSLMQAGMSEKASEHIQARLKVAPSTALFAQLLEVSDRLSDAGRADQAEANFRLLLAKGPPMLHERCLFALASAQLAQGKEADGEATLGRLITATKNRPVKSEAMFLLARHYDQAGKKEKAVRAWKNLLEDDRYRTFAKDRLKELSASR